MATRKQRKRKHHRRQASAKHSARQRSDFLKRCIAFNDAIDAQARKLEASSSPPKNHHWVPKTYLRHWATILGDGRIRATALTPPSRSFLNVPANLACRDHLYRIELDEVNEDELPPLAIEALLGHIEGNATPTLKRLVDHEVDAISVEEMAFFSLFLAFQKVRSPGALRHQQELESKIATQMVIAETTDPDARELFDSGRFRVAKPDGVYVGQMGQLAHNVAPHFFARTWVLFETSPTMLTCDEPVVLLPAPGIARRVRPGIEDTGAVIFPVSPQAVLVLFRNDLTPIGFDAAAPRIQRGSLSEFDAHELNVEIAMAADRWIFEAPNTRIGETFELPAAPPSDWPFQGNFEPGRSIQLHLPGAPTRWSDPAWENRALPVSSWWIGSEG